MRASLSVTGVVAFFVSLAVGCGKTQTVSDVLPIKATEVHGERLSISVVNTYGAVFLRGGRGLPTKLGGRLLRKVRAKGKDAAKKLLGQVTVETSGSGKERRFVVVAPKGHRKDVLADLELDVPVDSDVTVQTAEGNVRIFGVHGLVRVDVDRGKVELRGMQGKVEVSVKKGEIFLSGKLEGAQVVTGKGLVRVQWLSGWPKEPSTIRTKDGDLKLTVHKVFKASVRMAYGRGLHAGNLDVQKTGKGKARVELGQGGQLLTLEAPQGQVHLLRLSIVPPKPIKLKGPPPIRGGGLLKRPKGAKDVEKLREEDRKRFLEKEKQSGAARPTGAKARSTGRPSAPPRGGTPRGK